MSDDRPDVEITLTLSARVADLLGALVDPQWGHTGIKDVIGQLIDHAQQGVYRPGAWEREWLCQAFGYDWADRMEPDTRPGSLSADGRVIFQRPRLRGPGEGDG